MRIEDLATAMPDSAVTNGGHSVSQGQVFWTDENKVTCRDHRAMLCVSEDRHVWRCPTCNAGAYLHHED